MIRRRPPHRKRRLALRPPILLETKWGWMPCVELGWCAVPSAFLRHAAALGISPTEAWLLLQLLDLKWTEGRSTLDQLAERLRFGGEEIHHLLRSLETRGYLKLNPRHVTGPSSNGSSARGSAPPLVGWEIDLSSLLQALNEYVMRDGDLSAGFLKLSSIRIEGEAK